MPDENRKRWIDGLTDEDLAFVKRFILASGSLKELARVYGISYPTVRLRLDRLIEKIKVLDSHEIASEFERLLRVLLAEGRIDPTPFHAILAAHRNELEGIGMRRMAVVASLLALSGVAQAEETLAEFAWSRLQADGRLPAGTVVPAGGENPFESLAVENAADQPRTITVLTIDRPGVTGPAYAILGQVRHEAVEGTGYLEMLNYFPDGTAFFSRTLDTSGPLRSLSGTSGWRPFGLPFLPGDDPRRPNRLVINVVLPGRGTVHLGPLRLVEYEADETLFGEDGAWWSERLGGPIGGVGGGLMGLLGVMVGWLVHRGRGRRFVIGCLVGMVGLGAVGLAVGVAAGLSGQPYGVWFPPTLVGVLATALSLGLLPRARKHYEQIELRRMGALDAP